MASASRVCPTCDKALKCPEGVQDHMVDKHSKFWCYLCEKTFDSNDVLKKHMKDDHNVVRHRWSRKKKNKGRSKTRQSGYKETDPPQNFMLGIPVSVPTYGHAPRVTYPMAEFLEISPDNLNDYITTHLQPTEDYNLFSKTVIDDLVKFVQHNTGLKVNSVVKGGSFGKGTHVKDKADLDCVLILNDVSDIQDMKEKGDRILTKLEKTLRESTWASKIEIGYIESHGLQFDVTIKGKEKMAVDLCPIFQLLDQQPTRAKNAVIFRKIMTTCRDSPDFQTDRRFYSTALTKYQVDFVRKQETSVKSLIRLVKHWSKTVVKKESREELKYPKSYQYELITIHVWEKAGSPPQFNMANAFKAVLKKLVNYRTLHVFWTDFYDENIARDGMESMTGPIILDPSNPVDNVLERFYPDALDHVAQIATDTLRAPLLKQAEVELAWM